MRYKNVGTTLFCFVTIHIFYRQAENLGSTMHCITYSHMVKMTHHSIATSLFLQKSASIDV